MLQKEKKQKKKAICRSSPRDYLPEGTEVEEKLVKEIAGMKISSPCCSHVFHFSIVTGGMKDFMITTGKREI